MRARLSHTSYARRTRRISRARMGCTPRPLLAARPDNSAVPSRLTAHVEAWGGRTGLCTRHAPVRCRLDGCATVSQVLGSYFLRLKSKFRRVSIGRVIFAPHPSFVLPRQLGTRDALTLAAGADGSTPQLRRQARDPAQLNALHHERNLRLRCFRRQWNEHLGRWRVPRAL